VLCGGAINSPQLLLLSGIGNAGELRALGIEVVVGDGAKLRAADGRPAVVWRFELIPCGTDAVDLPGSSERLSVRIELDAAAAHLFRCDRVDLPAGSVTPRHMHLGPGLRCVLHGDVRAEVAGRKSFHRAGEAWFEAAAASIVGRMSPHEPTAFVRGMILPVELRGKSSYRPWDEAAAAQSVPARYQLFVDAPFRVEPPTD
jgi:hypothetical protein